MSSILEGTSVSDDKLVRFGRRSPLGNRSRKESVEVPGMIANQQIAFEKFISLDNDRSSADTGLQRVLESVFPIIDHAGRAQLEFAGYSVERPSYDERECIDRDVTYAAKVRIDARFIVWANAKDVSTGEADREVRSIKEQSVYICSLPLMTERGTFIVNGVEHVVVSQMHRSPGVFFDNDGGKTHGSGKVLFAAHVIPYRGSWLDIEFDVRDLINFRIDRKRKIYVSTLLMACGLSKADILKHFYKSYNCVMVGEDLWRIEFDEHLFAGVRMPFHMLSDDGCDVIVEANTKVSPRLIDDIKNRGIKFFCIKSKYLLMQCVASDVVSSDGQVFISIGDQISTEHLARIDALRVKSIELLLIDGHAYGSYIRDTIVADKNQTVDDALVEIYRVSRPGETISPELVVNSFKNLFFNASRYDLSDVGRVKINRRLGMDLPEDCSVLTVQDILRTIEDLIKVKDGYGDVDDIDHLGNRRVRSLNELVENQFRIGLVRMAKAALDRMAIVDLDSVMPHDLINPKLVSSVIREFFATSQLSQFMDQTNPLSEITHKRRLSALGPGGLNRDRAGFAVRDVHFTHYCRVCPVETSEGANIGLITSLAIYARVDKYGFIETPYRKVVDGRVTDEVCYLTASDEMKYSIVQADAKVDETGILLGGWVICRRASDIIMVAPSEVSFMDVSTKQIVSVAASLIPFLENNDANRALMGSNMQRQAVPLLCPKAPFVGTGMEERVARDSGAVVIARNDGIVSFVDGTKIIICSGSSNDGASDGIRIDIYELLKWRRTNFNTCINHRPLVNRNDLVKRGQVIADGFATDGMELALGSNALVAFMVWRGDNFEDSIVISESVVRDGMFTSVHIEEFECVARDTRLGPEEITRDIPGVSEEMLAHIDESGIIRVGAQVKTGDMLIGKITPKGESPMTPEEKLLRAVFCENAVDFRDSSLYVPSGVSGTVIDVKILSRKGVERDERALGIDKLVVDKLTKERDEKLAIVRHFVAGNIKKLLTDGVVKTCQPKSALAGKLLTCDILDQCSDYDLLHITITDDAVNSRVKDYIESFNNVKANLEKELQLKINTLFDGAELQHGVLKVIKVFVATKHKLQPGDKMAGRHGNKGVISRIVPVADMPYLEDGRPVDIILNPLGIPSRMNSGQIMEAYLGLAAVISAQKALDLVRGRPEGWQDQVRSLLKNFYGSEGDILMIDALSDEELSKAVAKVSQVGGFKVACPVFEGAGDKTISDLLEAAGLDRSGQCYLYDGYTGERFDRKVTVGYLYMLKLHHLVDNKIHARSTGPYSLVTQQPLGGKAYFGGQRLGEMECWALEAYGAAYTLRESLTIKSDDVNGRVMAYESIVRGENDFVFGVPESFNVMVKELSALCLRVECISAQDIADEEEALLPIKVVTTGLVVEGSSSPDSEVSDESDSQS